MCVCAHVWVHVCIVTCVCVGGCVHVRTISLLSSDIKHKVYLLVCRVPPPEKCR